jgi:hypothetical protein
MQSNAAVDPPPPDNFTPTFESPGRLELVRTSTWTTVKELPCVVRTADEPEGADAEDPATGTAALQGDAFEKRFDRRNVVHVEWVARDLLLAVSKRGDLGALSAPLTTHYQIDT